MADVKKAAEALADILRAAPSSVSVGKGGLTASQLARRVRPVLEAGQETPYTRLGSEFFPKSTKTGGRAKDPTRYTGYSSVKSAVHPSEWETTGRNIGGILGNVDIVEPSDLFGRKLAFATGDKTARAIETDTLNGVRLQKPSVQHGGGEFMGNVNSELWGSNLEGLKPKVNAWNKLPIEDQMNLLLGYMPMSDKSGDFAEHTSDTFGGVFNAMQAGNQGLLGSNVRKIDDIIRQKFADEKFAANMPSVGSSGWSEWLKSLGGTERSKMLKALDKQSVQSLGMPDVGAVRWATTDPNLVNADQLSVGYRFGTPELNPQMYDLPDHPSYSHSVLRREGTAPMALPFDVPWTIGARDIARKRIPVGATDMRAKPEDLKALMINPKLSQDIDQQWVDEASNYGELLKNSGKDVADNYAAGLLHDYWMKGF